MTPPDYLQVALDVSGDGRLSLPPYQYSGGTQIHNITLFLSSYQTGMNLTISNGTAAPGNACLGNIMLQEPGSTVKHVNWIWPDCLVGNGGGQMQSPDPGCACESARGEYNASDRPPSASAAFSNTIRRSPSTNPLASTAPTTTPSSTFPSRSRTLSLKKSIAHPAAP
jgi:hypothetical protein